MVDRNGNQVIEYREEDILRVFVLVCRNGNQVIEYREFRKTVKEYWWEFESLRLFGTLYNFLEGRHSTAHQLFKEFDRDQSGELDETEFIRAMRKVGTPLGEEEILRVFELVDRDGNQVIEYREFRKSVKEYVMEMKGLQHMASLDDQTQRAKAKFRTKEGGVGHRGA